MTVTSDDVRSAYRLLLEREPESDAVIERRLGVADVRSLRQLFMSSPEYLRANPQTGPNVGAYFADPAGVIEVEASPVQRQAMLDRIGKAWAAYGETEPHWSVLTQGEYLQDNLGPNIAAFYESGRGDVDGLLAFANRAGASAGPSTRAMDFGCGVGRLTLALAERFDSVVGLDISPGHLRLARERAADTGTQNAYFERVRAVDDLHHWLGAFDFVISCIVLQHNPPPIMAALLEGMLRTLAPGGTAIIQLPTFIPGQSFKIADYLANAQPQMEMNALPQRFVFEIIERARCQTLEVREDGRTGTFAGVSQTFAIRRR